MLKKSLFLLFFVFVGKNAIAQSEVKDSVGTAPVSENRWKKFSAGWKPLHTYAVLDASKILGSALNTSNTQIELGLDMFCRNKNWAFVSLAQNFSNFSNTALQYTSQSTGGTVAFAKSLFPFVHDADQDNAFVGIGYGLAWSRVGEVTYQIKDVWGVNNGTVNPRNGFTHSAQLLAGFRMRLSPKVIAGWQMSGRVLLNESAFPEVPPLQIANFGAGDKGTAFGYNLMIGYKIH
jgi:hypothetical protein